MILIHFLSCKIYSIKAWSYFPCARGGSAVSTDKLKPVYRVPLSIFSRQRVSALSWVVCGWPTYVEVSDPRESDDVGREEGRSEECTEKVTITLMVAAEDTTHHGGVGHVVPSCCVQL